MAAKRLFVAVRPPDDVLDAVEEALGPARKSLVGPRWMSRDQWHVTLQFLGSVDEEQVGDVARSLESVSSVQPFPARLGTAGAFPRVRRGRVIWIGLVGGQEAMAELAGSVERSLVPVGFEPEDRDFHGHLTVARLRNPGDVSPAVEALGEEPVGPAFTVSDVVLYESRRSRAGARYEAVSVVGLEG